MISYAPFWKTLKEKGESTYTLINKHGISYYRDLVARYCNVKTAVVDSLPKGITFTHARGPLQQDIEKVNNWLKTSKK